MKNKKNILVIGSNFGKIHFEAANASKKFSRVFIASPNIQKKKISKNFIKYSSAVKAINNEDFEMITIATKPKIQNEIIKYIKEKKKYPKYLFLEKPIFNSSIKVLKKFPKQFLFNTNFIFSFEKKWKKFKKIIDNFRDIKSFEYNWFFKQAFYLNKKKTWKIDNAEGGGLINYYLPHAIFNILYNFKNVKFYKIKKKAYKDNKLVFLEIVFLFNKNHSTLKICNNSQINLHSLSFNSSKVNYSLINSSKNWLSGFKIFKFKKEIFKTKKKLKKKDSRYYVLLDIYTKLQFYFSRKNIESNKNLTYKTFELINIINKNI